MELIKMFVHLTYKGIIENDRLTILEKDCLKWSFNNPTTGSTKKI